MGPSSKVDPLTMLNEAKRICDQLVRPDLTPPHLSCGHHVPSFKIPVSSSVNRRRPSILLCLIRRRHKRRHPLLQRQIPNHRLSSRTLLRSSCLSVSQALRSPCIPQCTLRPRHATRLHPIINTPPHPAITRRCPVSQPHPLRHPRLHLWQPNLSPLLQRLPPLSPWPPAILQARRGPGQMKTLNV